MLCTVRSSCAGGSSGYMGSERLRSRKTLGVGKVAAAVAEVSEDRLQVAGDRIVDAGLDAVRVQPRSKGVTAITANHEQVVHVAPRRFDAGKIEREVAEPCAVRIGEIRAAPVPVVEVAQLDPQHRSLDGVQSSVERGELVPVLDTLTVVADGTRAFRQLRGPGDDGAGVAVRAEVLAGIEAEAGGDAKGTGSPAVQHCPMRLGRVFDDQHLGARRNLEDGLDVAEATEEMHRHDRPGARPYRRVQRQGRPRPRRRSRQAPASHRRQGWRRGWR